MTHQLDSPVTAHLQKLLEEGETIESDVFLDRWAKKVRRFLETALDPVAAATFYHTPEFDPWDEHAIRLGHLGGLIAKSQEPQVASSEAEEDPADLQAPGHPAESREVFLVHGHDNEAKEMVARFLERVTLQPIILHEQASGGRTIIEKFEKYSKGVAFAVVLLTPDDEGRSWTPDDAELQPRARQNVILELGYFMGRLGRTRVCALYKGGVELPSDYQGVLYVELDPAGGWKVTLANELVQAGLRIDVKKALG